MNFVKKRFNRLISILLIFIFSISQVSFGFTLTGRILTTGELYPKVERDLPPATEMEMFLDRYAGIKRDKNATISLINKTEYVAKTANTVGTAIYGVANPVVAAVAGQVIGDSIAAVGDSLRSSINKELDNYLEVGLDRVVLQSSNRELRRYTGTSAESARKIITGHSDIFDFKRMGFDRPEERDAIQEVAITVLANKMTESMLHDRRADLAIDDHAEKIQDLAEKSKLQGQRLHGLYQTYKAFSIQITKNVAEIEVTTKMLVKQVTINVEHISENRGQINNVQASLFNKMSGEEKVKALDTGWFPQLTETERLNEMKMAESQRSLEYNFAMINLATSEIPKAIGLFTSDPNLINSVNTAAQASSAVMAVMAASSMGPFGMALAGLGAMGSIFGGKGGDGGKLEAKRHEQVMKKLDVVIENQVRMSEQMAEMHRSLAQGQEEIFKMVKAVGREIILLSEKIDLQHAQEMKALDLIGSNVLVNTELIRSLALDDPNACKIFFNSNLARIGTTLFMDQFASFEQMKNHLMVNKVEFKKCSSGIFAILTSHLYSDGIHPLLFDKSYLNRENARETYVVNEEIYQPSRFFYSQSRAANEPLSYHELISTLALKTFVNAAIEVYPYMLVIKDPESLESLDTQGKEQIKVEVIKKVVTLLEGSLSLINEAIFQQEIIAGVNWAQKLVTRIDNQTLKADEKEALHKLIKANPTVAKNLVQELVSLKLKQTNASLSYYQFLNHVKNSYPLLDGFFGKNFTYSHENQVWKINFNFAAEDPHFVELPSYEELSEKRFNHFQDLNVLYDLRNTVVEHLSLVKAMR